jgi:hypothetical protein
MASATDTITETTFKEGSSSIYVSLYRVKRSGLLMDSVTKIIPTLKTIVDINDTLGSSDISAIGDGTVTGGLSQLNSDLNNNLSLNELTVTADGVKTRAELFNELYAAFVSGGYDVNADSYISFQGILYKYSGYNNNTGLMFNTEISSGSQITLASISLKATASTTYVWVISTSSTQVNDRGSDVPASGTRIMFHCKK